MANRRAAKRPIKPRRRRLSQSKPSSPPQPNGLCRIRTACSRMVGTRLKDVVSGLWGYRRSTDAAHSERLMRQSGCLYRKPAVVPGRTAPTFGGPASMLRARHRGSRQFPRAAFARMRSEAIAGRPPWRIPCPRPTPSGCSRFPRLRPAVRRASQDPSRYRPRRLASEAEIHFHTFHLSPGLKCTRCLCIRRLRVSSRPACPAGCRLRSSRRQRTLSPQDW